MSRILYVTAGPPCSGKSTFCRKLIEDGKTVRINRDDLRLMLLGKIQMNQTHENFINSVIKRALIYYSTRSNVILDATHCKVKYLEEIKQIIKDFGLDFEIVVIFFNVSYNKQRIRNLKRFLSTGIWIPSSVSKTMNKNYLELKSQINPDGKSYIFYE